MKVILPIYNPINSGKPKLFCNIAQKLQEYGITVVPITFGVNANQILKTFKIASKGYDLKEYLDNTVSKLKLTDNLLEEYEQRYGVPNLWFYNYVPYEFFRYIPEDKFFKTLIAYFKFWEYVFNKEHPDAYFDEGIGGYMLTVTQVCKAKNVLLLNALNSKIPNRIFLKHNMYDRVEDLVNVYNEIKSRNLTTEEYEEAYNYYVKFHLSKSVPLNDSINKKLPPLTLKAPITFLKSLVTYGKEQQDETNSIINPFTSAKQSISNYINSRWIKFLNLWEEPNYDEKYILYPMHSHAEITTDLYSPFYADQIGLIINIAKSMPVGYKLYVKEHAVMGLYGFRSTNYYKAIKSIHNVKLINPYADIHVLIKNSSAVLVTAGSAGWEGIMYGKPVIVFGNPFYDIFDCVTKVKNINELPNILYNAVHKHKDVMLIDLLKVISAQFKTSYQGELMWDIPEAHAEENYNNIANAIIKECNKHRS